VAGDTFAASGFSESAIKLQKTIALTGAKHQMLVFLLNKPRALTGAKHQMLVFLLNKPRFRTRLQKNQLSVSRKRIFLYIALEPTGHN
jgi:hypothetical protein